MKFKHIIASLLISCFVTLESNAQDLDQDSLDDRLEEALARRFAPEWRFHKSTGSGSNQNEDEVYFPSSIEWFYDYIVQQQGYPPNLIYTPTGDKAPIRNINNLGSMIVPGTSKTTDDPSWGSCKNEFIKITDYPEKIPGDPNGFPTYFRCYKLDDGRIGIGYFLFYPQDYKGSYCVLGVPFTSLCAVSIEKGKHRGDWEGVNIVISGISDYNNPNSVLAASLEQVKFSGHGVSRYILSTSSRFRAVFETHPRVYIAFGAHATYPEPGNWTDYKIDQGWGLLNWYDDYFLGNGLVVQSWQSSRSLINLGETSAPFVGWLNYKGLWGPDGDAQEGSPPSPPCKSPWTENIEGYFTWEDALLPQNYDAIWEDPFHLDCSPDLGAVYIPDPNYDCDFYVDYRVTCPDGIAPSPLISEGISNVPEGGVVCIAPGYYPEDLNIDKPLILSAYEGPVIIGGSNPNPIVQQTDYNNYNQISNLRVKEAKTLHISNIDIYPNPSTGTIHLNYHFSEPTIVNVYLLNAVGRRTKTLLLNENLPMGEFSQSFTLSELPIGIYYCVLETSKDRKLQKLVITK